MVRKHKTSKGFTIVELVIVIAVVAILAAVLIPTFASIINKANLSNDKQAIANMNKVSMVENVLDEFEYPSDAVTALYANGWNEGKLTPYSKDYHYAYNSENKKFYLLDNNDEVVYPETTEKTHLWAFYNNSRTDKVGGVSNYIALDNITEQTYFVEVFNGGSYTIDLYHHYISTAKPEGTTIKLINGVVSGSGTGYDTDVSVKTRVDATKIEKNAEGKYDDCDNLTYTYGENGAIAKMVIENLIFDVGTNNANDDSGIMAIRSFMKNGKNTLTDADRAIDVTIKNCSFEGALDVRNTCPQASKVTFEGCTFNYSSTGYAITIGGVNGGYGDCINQPWSVTVKDCIIQSKGRGINLSSAPADKDQRFIFTGNTFIIEQSNDNGMALQIAGAWALTEDFTYTVTVNNEPKEVTAKKLEFKEG